MRISDWSSDVCSSDLIAVLAREAQREPVLRLAPVPPLPDPPRQFVRQVVADRIAAFGHDFSLGRAYFLGKLAHCSLPGRLAWIDAALGQLPMVAGRSTTAAHEEGGKAVGKANSWEARS